MLTFNFAEVQKLIAHAKGSKENYVPYEGKSKKKGLVLVGDHGIYLMSNGFPDLMASKDKRYVVYAETCNPDTMDFDEWYDIKRSVFGGDDGCEFISMEDVEGSIQKGLSADKKKFRINLTPTSMSL